MNRQSRRARRLSALAAALLLNAARPASLSGAPPENEWPTWRGPPALTGFAPDGIPGQPTPAWRVRVGRDVEHTPIVAGQRIFGVADGSTWFAIDLAGNVLWTVTPYEAEERRPRFVSPLAFCDGVLIGASQEGMVHGIEASSGNALWRASIDGQVLGAPVPIGAGRVAIIEQSSGRLYALRATTGERVWVGEPTARCDGSPASDGETIAFGSCAAGFHIVDAATGTLHRFVFIGEGKEMAGGVALGDGTLYSGNRAGGMVAVDGATGQVLWENEEPRRGEIFTTPALTADTLVFMDARGAVHALRRSDGAPIWSHRTTAQRPTSPAVDGHRVLVAAAGTLQLLSIETGKELWSFYVADGTTSPAVANRMIFVGTDEGEIVAFAQPIEEPPVP